MSVSIGDVNIVGGWDPEGVGLEFIDEAHAVETHHLTDAGTDFDRLCLYSLIDSAEHSTVGRGDGPQDISEDCWMNK